MTRAPQSNDFTYFNFPSFLSNLKVPFPAFSCSWIGWEGPWQPTLHTNTSLLPPLLLPPPAAVKELSGMVRSCSFQSSDPGVVRHTASASYSYCFHANSQIPWRQWLKAEEDLCSTNFGSKLEREAEVSQFTFVALPPTAGEGLSNITCSLPSPNPIGMCKGAPAAA